MPADGRCGTGLIGAAGLATEGKDGDRAKENHRNGQAHRFQ